MSKIEIGIHEDMNRRFCGPTPIQVSKVFSVVVTHNGSPWIEKCAESLLSSHYPIHIIVVDNSSTDDTLQLLEGKSSLQCVSLQDNVGFGRANNIGISMALEQGADYVFLLNQDAHIRPDTIEKLIRGMAQNPAFGILSPLHLNADGTAIDQNFARYIATQGAELFYSDLLFGRNNSEKVYPIRFVNAAAWMISRKCLLTVGGFDPLFFMYGEDDDYCRRVHMHDLQIGMLPGALIYHVREKSNHAEEKRSAVQRLGPLYAREMSHAILRLKAPGNFLRITASWYMSMLSGGVRALASLHTHRLVLQLFMLIRLTLLLPKIHAHRQMSVRTGPTWLQTNAATESDVVAAHKGKGVAHA